MIKEADARTMVALLGKVIGINGPAAEKRKQLMNGICELIDASFWVWATMGRTEEGEMVTFSLRQQGGFSDQQMAGYLKAQEHPDMARLNVPLLAEYTKKEGPPTRNRATSRSKIPSKRGLNSKRSLRRKICNWDLPRRPPIKMAWRGIKSSWKKPRNESCGSISWLFIDTAVEKRMSLRRS